MYQYESDKKISMDIVRVFIHQTLLVFLLQKTSLKLKRERSIPKTNENECQ